MLSVKLICIGKLKEKFYSDAVNEYKKRLSACCRLEIEELPEQRLPESPSASEIEAALSREAAAVFSRIPAGALLVSMCVEGESMTSEQLSRFISQSAVSGASRLCFVIGGSYGLHESVKSASRLRLSMSAMTFPHHLARVMLLEQLYRSFKILDGSKYHK